MMILQYMMCVSDAALTTIKYQPRASSGRPVAFDVALWGTARVNTHQALLRVLRGLSRGQCYTGEVQSFYGTALHCFVNVQK